MEISLFIHNISYVIGILFVACLTILVFIKGVDRKQAIILALASFCVLVFQISHVIGVNITDPETSRRVLMFNLTNLFIITFLAHWVVTVIGNETEERLNLILMYSSAILIFVFAVFNSNLFLIESVPKMYFPNYYEPGPLYAVMLLHFFMGGMYFLYQLIRTYIRSNDGDFRNRIKYVFTGLGIGIVFGPIAFLLVYDIKADPAFSAIFSLFPFFFAYAMAKYKLLDIHVVAHKALVYGGGVALATTFLSLVSFGNILLLQTYPQVSFWFIPLVTSIFAFLIGGFVWRKIRESDILKYEFVTVVTHKFETPLTQIKWAISNLIQDKDSELVEDQKVYLKEVLKSVDTLIKLTHLLVGVSYTSNQSFKASTIALSQLINDVENDHLHKIKTKNLIVHKNIGEDINIYVSKEQILTVFNVILENSIAYTPEGGEINISASHLKGRVVLEFQDNGIGIDPNESKLIGSSFFRTGGAKKADTEGMGLGLYLAREIIKNNGGKIEISSEGINKGTNIKVFIPTNPK